MRPWLRSPFYWACILFGAVVGGLLLGWLFGAGVLVGQLAADLSNPTTPCATSRASQGPAS